MMSRAPHVEYPRDATTWAGKELGLVVSPFIHKRLSHPRDSFVFRFSPVYQPLDPVPMTFKGLLRHLFTIFFFFFLTM